MPDFQYRTFTEPEDPTRQLFLDLRAHFKHSGTARYTSESELIDFFCCRGVIVTAHDDKGKFVGVGFLSPCWFPGTRKKPEYVEHIEVQTLREDVSPEDHPEHEPRIWKDHTPDVVKAVSELLHAEAARRDRKIRV